MQRCSLQESRMFYRVPGLDGIEFLTVENSPTKLRCYAAEYAIATPSTWHGEVQYRGRKGPFAPGIAFCVVPGESLAFARVHRAGSYRVTTFDPAIFENYLGELDVPVSRFDWAQDFHHMSAGLSQALGQMLSATRPGTQSTALEVQSRVITLFERLASELIRCPSWRPLRSSGMKLAERIRERLHQGRDPGLDLETLAREFGVSRFQALRTFTQRYGLPPHTYLSRVRNAYARELLRKGHSGLEVATTCGYADQSHFVRDFRRLTGMTPYAYSRACTHHASIQRSARPMTRSSRNR